MIKNSIDTNSQSARIIFKIKKRGHGFMSKLTETFTNILMDARNGLESQIMRTVNSEEVSVNLAYLLKVTDEQQQVQQQLSSFRRWGIKNFNNIEGKNHEASSCNGWYQD